MGGGGGGGGGGPVKGDGDGTNKTLVMKMLSTQESTTQKGVIIHVTQKQAGKHSFQPTL